MKHQQQQQQQQQQHNKNNQEQNTMNASGRQGIDTRQRNTGLQSVGEQHAAQQRSLTSR
jgi:hypothetical protein